MDPKNIPDIIRTFFSAFLSGDRKTLENLMGDHFSFNSPRDDHISRAVYFERCFPNSNQIHELRIEQIFTQGNEALVRYQAELVDGTRFRNCEYFRIENGKVQVVNVYFGATLKDGGEQPKSP